MERRASQFVLVSPFTWLALLLVVGLEIAFYRWFQPPITLAALMIGITIPQLATPLARIISPFLLESGDWHMLYWLEMGLALAMLSSILARPLPPSERTTAFEREDFFTLALLAPGLWLMIAVLCQGRIVWWTESAWLGWALAGSVIMIVTALVLEHYRGNPLINTRWLGTREMLRLMFIAAAVRLLLSE